MKKIGFLLSGLAFALCTKAQTEDNGIASKTDSLKVGNMVVVRKEQNNTAAPTTGVNVQVTNRNNGSLVKVNNWVVDVTKNNVVGDTTVPGKADTIRVGGMVIIRRGDGSNNGNSNEVKVNVGHPRTQGRVSTNWWVVDLGFANVSDNTNYASAEAQAFAPGLAKGNLDLRTGKSVNVNIWVFMQRIRLIEKAVSLKYGLGVELNNYHFDDKRILLREENPTIISLDNSLAGYKKNKLAADYVTVPMMLSFTPTNKGEKGFGFSLGVSGGYLYSARQKFKDDGDVSKNHDNYDLRKFKLSYVGELNLGVVRLYGSVAAKSMWERGLDQTPFTVGLRLSYL